MDNLPRKKNKKKVGGIAWRSVASTHHKAEDLPDAGLWEYASKYSKYAVFLTEEFKGIFP